MPKKTQLSPMMSQYRKMKSQYEDYILMYRLGDFYEMFFEDAVIASKELDIVLTARDCGLESKAPMCGVPFHSVDSYVSKLVSKGYKVTICEQIKDEATNEVTGREVVRMVTPGTITDPAMLDAGSNNYIVAAFTENNQVCMCAADVSTGEILLSYPMSIYDGEIYNELCKYTPKEIYINGSPEGELKRYMQTTTGYTQTDGTQLSFEQAEEYVNKQLGKSLNDMTDRADKLMTVTLGSLIKYLLDTQLCSLSHVNKLTFIGDTQEMIIDASTWRNLEIVCTMRNKEKSGSLLGAIDKTKTPMGARMLRHFLERPLTSTSRIADRQSIVSDLYKNNIARADIRRELGSVRDIERLLTRVVYGSVNPRELLLMADSFRAFPRIAEVLRHADFESEAFKKMISSFDTLSDVEASISRAISADAPISVREGDIIKDGYSNEVDNYRYMLTDAKNIMAKLEADEKEKTGIKNLKVGYNKVFGYYIEVSNSNKDMVPDSYIRKQTLVNGERFITPELKEIESKLLSARENLVKLEYDLFCKIRQYVLSKIDSIRDTTEKISYIDVFSALAEVASKNAYVCPSVDTSGVINIKDGRHPVVEQTLKNDIFVPNDVFLDNEDNRVSIITGPNMAGKSTYMRSVALITLLAQIGSYVPAASAKIGICDKIFTRVGASDDLASGQSTFMLEMTEVAYILKNSTQKSLLIFDEIGRGTSTFDGMSIARAVLEYVAEKIRAKTLFATHYHELTALENTLEGVKNYNVAAKKRGDSITFLRKIVPGGTDDSYGIDVARLAGVPKPVIDNAEKILKELELGSSVPRPAARIQPETVPQTHMQQQILDKLKNTDATVLTPIEALNVLFDLTKQARALDEVENEH